MTVEGGLRLVAGTVVLVTTAMGHPACPLFVSEHVLFVTGAVAFMLVQSVFTGICPTATVLRKMGLKSSEQRGAIAPSP